MNLPPEDVRPRCIFCQQRFTYEPAGDRAAAEGEKPIPRVPVGVCEDPRTKWGHVEMFNSTRQQREARFGPVPVKPTAEEHAAIVRELKGQPPAIEVKELPPQTRLF